MTPKEMTPEEAYQEALRRIAVAREQRLTELDLTDLPRDRIPPELFELEWLTVLSTTPTGVPSSDESRRRTGHSATVDDTARTQSACLIYRA